MQTKKKTRKPREKSFNKLDFEDIISLISAMLILTGAIVGFIIGILTFNILLILLFTVCGLAFGVLVAFIILILSLCISTIKDCFRTRG